MPTPASHLQPLASDRGMSIVELLVAMLISTVVIGALVALLEVTINQETRITQRVQADQLGRTAMSNVVEKLHSSCTGFGAPIRAPAVATKSGEQGPQAAGPTSLWFISVYGQNIKALGEHPTAQEEKQYDEEEQKSSVAALPEVVTEHDIVWEREEEHGKPVLTNTSKEFGTLVDYAFTGESKEPPNWQFPSELKKATATKTTVLARDVIAPLVAEKSTIFQYYKYTGGVLTELGASELDPLLTSTAEEVAKVAITFEQAASPTATSKEASVNEKLPPDTRPGRTSAFSSAVVLRYSPSETSESKTKPCE